MQCKDEEGCVETVGRHLNCVKKKCALLGKAENKKEADWETDQTNHQGFCHIICTENNCTLNIAQARRG